MDILARSVVILLLNAVTPCDRVPSLFVDVAVRSLWEALKSVRRECRPL